MNIYDLLQLLGGIILSLGYIPQIIKLVKTKSSHDFNINSFLMVFIGIVFMEIYAVNLVCNGSGCMYLITNTMSLTVQGIMLWLINKYRGG